MVEEYKIEGKSKRLCVAVECVHCRITFLKRKDRFIARPLGPHFCSLKCLNEEQHQNRYKDGQKFCGGCSKYLNVDDFVIRSNGKTRVSRCIECNRQRRLKNAPVGTKHRPNLPDPDENGKYCIECQLYKFFAEFNKRSVSFNGHMAVCKICLKQRRNNDHYRKLQKQQRLKDPIRYKEIARVGHRRRKYGITNEQYEKLKDDQNGVCAICSCAETSFKKGILCDLSVDHCHQTGKVRGLLCDACNNGLGRFHDNIEIMRRAIEYVEEGKKR